MYTVKDYIKWRGDLTFEQDGFNEVDNLLMCCMSYVNLDEAYTNLGKEEVTVRELGREFFRVFDKITDKSKNLFFDEYRNVFRLMCKSKRFGGLLVRNYNGIMDREKTIQFAAMECVISDRLSYVVYRGTDDSIIGWEEDMLMSMDVTGAEREASKYLNKVMAQDDRRIMVGGHSKGAHLAEYACLFVKDEYQDRITDIYCNDGPGFLDEFLFNVDYHKIERKIRRYMPEDSVVGQLLTGIGDPIPVKAQKSKIFQHTATNWAVEGTNMVRARDFSEYSIRMKHVMTEWLDSFEEEEKTAFFMDLFTVLDGTGEEDFTSVKDNGMKGLQSVIRGFNSLNPETKEKMLDVIKDMIVEKRRKSRG